MKLRAYNKKLFTVDVWDYVDTFNGTQTTRTYSYKETIKVNMFTDNTTRLILNTDAPISKNFQFRNLKDRNNQVIMNNYYWLVNSNEPIINAFGLIEGYKVKTAAGVEL
jgi:plastocyanin domain-containing protein